MKVYLAAAPERREELRGYAMQLASSGHRCSSRWLWVDENDDQASGHQLASYAAHDIEDLVASEALVVFSGGGRGRRHVETGVALALGLPVVLVGERENAFHYLPEVTRVGSWPQARGFLDMPIGPKPAPRGEYVKLGGSAREKVAGISDFQAQGRFRAVAAGRRSGKTSWRFRVMQAARQAGKTSASKRAQLLGQIHEEIVDCWEAERLAQSDALKVSHRCRANALQDLLVRLCRTRAKKAESGAVLADAEEISSPAERGLSGAYRWALSEAKLSAKAALKRSPDGAGGSDEHIATRCLVSRTHALGWALTKFPLPGEESVAGVVADLNELLRQLDERLPWVFEP